MPFIYATFATSEPEAKLNESQKVHILREPNPLSYLMSHNPISNRLRNAETPDGYRAKRMVIPACVSLSAPFRGFMQKPPVSIAMEKMKTVPEVRIIEGLDK